MFFSFLKDSYAIEKMDTVIVSKRNDEFWSFVPADKTFSVLTI